MRALEKNKQDFYYCLYLNETDAVDDDNNYTGEKIPNYGEATLYRANISPAKGETQIELFGDLEDYDKAITIVDPNCPITKNSVLFVDKQPEYDSDNRPLYDYIVVKKAYSKSGFLALAIKKVR